MSLVIECNPLTTSAAISARARSTSSDAKKHRAPGHRAPTWPGCSAPRVGRRRDTEWGIAVPASAPMRATF
jgi:hypothetical protein